MTTRQQHNEKSPDLRGAQGVVYQVENMGRGGMAVLLGGVILAALLAGMAVSSAESMKEQLTQERARHAESESAERLRNNNAVAELRSRLEMAVTESRMGEYYILELDGKLMAGGFIPPSRGYGQWKKEQKK